MRVLVTGGTGFLGGELVRRLARDGHEVRCLVRSPDRAGDLAALGAELVRGDCTDPDSVAGAADGCTWIMHLAAVNEHWVPDPDSLRVVNVEGARNVMEAALRAGASRYIQVSTGLTFGSTPDVPFTEESLPGPVRYSAYAESKLEADRIAWELHRTRGLPLTIVYPGAVVGPGNTKQTGTYLTTMISGKVPFVLFPESVVTYVDVRDVVEIICRAAESEDSVGQSYLAGKESVSFQALNTMIGELAGVRIPGRRAPDGLVRLAARVLTAIADWTGRPPALGLAVDSIRTMERGFIFDGSKAERELGIQYRSLRQSLAEELAALAEAGSAAPSDGPDP